MLDNIFRIKKYILLVMTQARNETSLYELKIYGMTFRRTFHQAVKG